MEDIRLKTVDFEFEGHHYNLCCNMNVLADVQEAYDGNLVRALDTARGLRGTLTFLAAMLRDAADTQGMHGEAVCGITPRELGRRLTLDQTLEAGQRIFPLIYDALPHAEKQDESEKN